MIQTIRINADNFFNPKIPAETKRSMLLHPLISTYLLARILWEKLGISFTEMLELPMDVVMLLAEIAGSETKAITSDNNNNDEGIPITQWGIRIQKKKKGG